MITRAYRRTSGLRPWRMAALLAMTGVLMGVGPCGRLPGGMIWAGTERAPVSDWSFTRAHDLCAVEVRHRDPYSITAACFADGPRLYVGCMNCPGKNWAAFAMEDPLARVQFGDSVYPVTIRRITDPAARHKAWQARHGKFGRGDPAAVPEHWWLFSLTWRDPQGA